MSAAPVGFATLAFAFVAIPASAMLSPPTRTHTILRVGNDSVAFAAWLKADKQRPKVFAAFALYLREKSVGDVVPIWELARADVNNVARCGGQAFVMPPRNLWHNLVPALRIVKAHVIPAVGDVEVRSVFRAPSLNICASGAPHSRHLSFSAVDLVATYQPNARTTFSKLCTAWRIAGPRSGWGLGAYFDPARPTVNADGRFHVDATGWRSWGFSKHAASSGCILLKH